MTLNHEILSQLQTERCSNGEYEMEHGLSNLPDLHSARLSRSVLAGDVATVLGNRAVNPADIRRCQLSMPDL